MSKRSCSSEGDKDMLTRRLALCLRHHSFGLRERFCLICTYAELTLTGFCTPPQCQLTRSNILQQNAMWSLSLPSGIRCGRGRGRRGSRRRGWIGITSEKPLSFGGIVDYYSHKECLLTRALRVAYAELTRMPAVKIGQFGGHFGSLAMIDQENSSRHHDSTNPNGSLKNHAN